MKLLRSTLSFGGMTLISRVLGFARDVVVAQQFGAGSSTDAFFVAFRIPNFLRRLFGEGSFAVAFVPVLSEYKERRSRAELVELIDRVTGTLVAALLAVTAIGVLAAPGIIAVFAPGFIDEPRRFDLAGDMLRLTFPYLLFISLVALSGGILNTYGRFRLPAFTPVLLNVALIAAALGLAPRLAEPITALAWGVLAAGAAQLAIQVPALMRLGLLPRPRWGGRDPGVRRVLRLMVPTLLASSVAQVNLLVDTLVASFLAAGSVSWLYYSDRLLEFPLGVFGIALATVILPSLSARHANREAEAFSATLDWALRLVVLIAVPAAAGLAALAAPILTTLFQYNAFTGSDVTMASLSLMAYSLGLPAFMAVKVLERGFFARQNTATPVKVAVTAMTVNMGLNVVFVGALVWSGTEGPHAGLALASSASGFLNAGLLLLLLRRHAVLRPGPGWAALLARVIAAAVAMTAVLTLVAAPLQAWLARGALERAGFLLGLVGLGAVVYAAVLLLGGFRPRHLESARAQ